MKNYLKFITKGIWFLYTIVFLFLNIVCAYVALNDFGAYWYVLLIIAGLDAMYYVFSIDEYKKQ